MGIKRYLSQVQKIQRDVFGIIKMDISTSYMDDGDMAIHLTVYEYDYDKVREETGDYEIRLFDIYSFFSPEKNKKILDELKGYIDEQLGKYGQKR